MDVLDQVIRKISADLRLRLDQDRAVMADYLAFPGSSVASTKEGGIAEALKHIRQRFPEAVDQAIGYIHPELPRLGFDARDVSHRLRDRLNRHLELLFDEIRFASLPKDLHDAVKRQRDELEEVLQNRLEDFEENESVSAATIVAIPGSSPALAPASDRFVNLNHNSAEYRDAIEAVESVKDALDQQNDFPDLEAKEELAAELRAGLALLDAPRVFVDAAVVVLGRALGYLKANFGSVALGMPASAAWDALKLLLGWSG